jgi:hypothetical protein
LDDEHCESPNGPLRFSESRKLWHGNCSKVLSESHSGSTWSNTATYFVTSGRTTFDICLVLVLFLVIHLCKTKLRSLLDKEDREPNALIDDQSSFDIHRFDSIRFDPIRSDSIVGPCVTSHRVRNPIIGVHRRKADGVTSRANRTDIGVCQRSSAKRMGSRAKCDQIITTEDRTN